MDSKVARKGVMLSELQVAALGKAKKEKVAHGKMETCRSDYPDTQDACHVSHTKGIGKIYPQTFINTYSKVSTAKLYVRKIALATTDMLND
jgi:hypothetical protein